MSELPIRADRKKFSGCNLLYWLPGHMTKVNPDAYLIPCHSADLGDRISFGTTPVEEKKRCCTERRKGRMPVKPTEKEEEYFARKEFERKQKLEEQKQRALSGEERRKLQELHRMKCPKCGMELIEIDYRGIRVDRCSACLGMWLDAGEGEALIKLEKPILDKLFEVFRK